MGRRIQEDHKFFRDVIGGKTRRELRRLISSGGFVRARPKGGKMHVTIPKIDIPHIVCGDDGTGLGRGPGGKGKVIHREGSGQSQGAGGEHGEGIIVQVDLDSMVKFLQDELQLPDLKPKPSQTYEDVKTVYTDISKNGPESLRHTRRTLMEAIKRLATTGELNQKHHIPGLSVPIPKVLPINRDRRYRQYREIKIPSSNAVIFFIRDYSASVDDFRCEIINDMCWWIDIWIRKFYEKVERCYVIHDAEAEEVDSKTFYEKRMGGGTKVSTAFQLVSELLETKFEAHKYNVYVFYFGDGENDEKDNAKILTMLKEKFNPNDINMIGFTQVCPSYPHKQTLQYKLDEAIKAGDFKPDWLRTVNIGKERADSDGYNFSVGDAMNEEDRDKEILKAIKALLGKGRKEAGNL